MGWDGTGINCHGMGWDGTEIYVPWASLANSLFDLKSLNVKPSTSKVKIASYTTTSLNSSDRGLKSQNCWEECWYYKSSTHRLINS